MSHVSLNRVSFRGTELLMKIDSHGNSTFRESLLKFITRAIKLSFVHYSLSNPIKSLCKFFCFIIYFVCSGLVRETGKWFRNMPISFCRLDYRRPDAREKKLDEVGTESNCTRTWQCTRRDTTLKRLLSELVVKSKVYHLCCYKIIVSISSILSRSRDCEKMTEMPFLQLIFVKRAPISQEVNPWLSMVFARYTDSAGLCLTTIYV